MPVLNPITLSLELLYVRSIASSGNPIYETRRFRNVKVDAAPETLYEVAEAIAAISVGEFSNYQITTASQLTA